MIRITLIIRIARESWIRSDNPIIERTWRWRGPEGRNMVHRSDGPAIIDSFPGGTVIKRFFLDGNEKKE